MEKNPKSLDDTTPSDKDSSWVIKKVSNKPKPSPKQEGGEGGPKPKAIVPKPKPSPKQEGGEGGPKPKAIVPKP